jgi:hypothetical protein
MMTEEQQRRVAGLRAVIEAAAPTREGAPMEVRAAAVDLKLELRRGGTTARVLAAALGVHESTLCRWERESGVVTTAARAARPAAARGRGAGFRAVAVVAPKRTPPGVSSLPAAAPPTRAIRVAHAPSGLVIDGLDVDALSALLRSLS